MPDAATLSTRQSQRTALSRQLLLERSALDIPAALVAVAGLQSQYAPTMYIGLWSRLADFVRADLTTALQRREVIQATMMRGTIHLVSRDDYWPMIVAIREPMRAWWARTHGTRYAGVDLPAAVDRVRAALHSEGSLPTRDLERIAGAKLFAAVAQLLDLVRVPPSGTWEHRRADRYALADQWVGRPPKLRVDDAVDHLVRRYLAGFGPSTRQEIATWGGIRLTDVAPAIERLGTVVHRLTDGTEVHDLDALQVVDAEAPAPVRFLSNWEALLLVHKRRTGILREDDRPRIFSNRAPQSFATFLVDGVVAGTWKVVRGDIELNPFRPLPTRVRAAVSDEAARLAAFHR